MGVCDRQIITWVIVAIILTILVCYICFYAYCMIRQQQFMSQFTQSSRSCSDIDGIDYREQVYIPQQNGVYEHNLSVALLDIAINTTKANCDSVLPLPNPPGFTNQLRIDGVEPLTSQPCMFAYIFWNESTGQVAIAFTGTASKAVAQNNLQYQQTAPTELNGYQDGVLCHEGFNAIYDNIRDQIWDWWTHHQSWIRTLFVTGHSLGGALSTLCSYDLADQHVELIHYSFATPRVGNVEFVDLFEQRVPQSIRVNNTEDIIPQLPPAVLDGYIYKQTEGNVPFTVAMDTLAENHAEAYIDFMPTCPEVAMCNTD